MEDFVQIHIANALVLEGAGLAMSMDSTGEMFYALLLEGVMGIELRPVEVQVIIPPPATQQFLSVIKAMEPKRE